MATLFVVANVLSILCTSSEMTPISAECPDPNFRNPYDPRMGFNLHLGQRDYALHARSDLIINKILENISILKISWSRPVAAFVVEPDSNWDEYEVWYDAYSTTQSWTTFRCPGADWISTDYPFAASYSLRSSEDFPFLIFDANHSVHGEYTELRGFHTFVDHTAKRIYCEGCGLFKYNNNGEILNPDGVTMSDGTDFDYEGKGQGTGSGLSWPGLIRRDDVLSGVIAHAPAVKTDQPKSCGIAVNDTYKVEMGYRLRLSPTVDCSTRLAPMIQTNGNWYPPTEQQTAFVRMFCVALQEYGLIISDGGPYRSLTFQGENQVTANWTEVFGSPLDDSTGSWSYLIRDMSTPSDNRYRDERYGIPWHQLVVLEDSMVGEVRMDCCLNSTQCTASTPTPQPTAVADTTQGPECLNENCCFKHRTITEYPLRIADDNCVVYNCTFDSISSSDIIRVSHKRDGTLSYNTLIEAITVIGSISGDIIDIYGGNRTIIRNNNFVNEVPTNYVPVRLQQAVDTFIYNNTFADSTTTYGVYINIDTGGVDIGEDVELVRNTQITQNVFSNLQHGVLMKGGSNTLIEDNLFQNILQDAVRWKYEDIYKTRGVSVQNNEMNNIGNRAVYVRNDDDIVLIANNMINNTGSHGVEFAGTTTGAVIDSNTVLNLAGNGLSIGVGNNDMQIISNEIYNAMNDHGINIDGDNYLIQGNTVHWINQVSPTETLGRAIYVKSYGTINGNLVYSSTRRGISYSGSQATAADGELIIENNVVYAIGQDSIHIYKGTYSPSKGVVRFNTVINDVSGENAFYSDSGMNTFEIYCNIFVATSETLYVSNRAHILQQQNYQALWSDMATLQFVDAANHDFRLQSGSPATGFCNGLNETLYSISQTDIAGMTRNAACDIDAGAYQRSPCGVTLSPTPSSTTVSPSPSSPTSVSPTTVSPTASSPSTVSPTPVEATIAETLTTDTPTTEDLGSSANSMHVSLIVCFVFFAVSVFVC